MALINNLIALLPLLYASSFEDTTFPYCFQEFSGTIEQSALLLANPSVTQEYQCQFACIAERRCKTFTFSSEGVCTLYVSGYYHALTSLTATESANTKVAYRCTDSCSRLSTDTCENSTDIHACTLQNNNCVASCDAFQNENILTTACQLAGNTVQCGADFGPCFNGSVVGASGANLNCHPNGGCSDIQAFSLNQVDCGNCEGSVFDTVATLTANSLRSSDLLNVETLLCEQCDFAESSLLSVNTLRVPFTGGLQNVHAGMQAEVASLECITESACTGLHIHVESLECTGSACTGSTFLALSPTAVAKCVGAQACAGSTFDGFSTVYCIGADSCANAMFFNVDAKFCFTDSSLQTCNNILPRHAFHTCIAWVNGECVTRQPSESPSQSTPTFAPSTVPSHAPSFTPSLQPTPMPTIYVAVRQATLTCQGNERYDMHLATCEACPDGFEPTFTRLDCAQCGANSAGTGGACNACASFISTPNKSKTGCQANVLIILLLVICCVSLCISAYLLRSHCSGAKSEPAKSKPKKKKPAKDSAAEKPSEKKKRRGSPEPRRESRREEKRKSLIEKRNAPEKRKSLIEKRGTPEKKRKSLIEKRNAPEKKRKSLIEKRNSFREESSPSRKSKRKEKKKGKDEKPKKGKDEKPKKGKDDKQKKGKYDKQKKGKDGKQKKAKKDGKAKDGKAKDGKVKDGNSFSKNEEGPARKEDRPAREGRESMRREEPRRSVRRGESRNSAREESRRSQSREGHRARPQTTGEDQGFKLNKQKIRDQSFGWTNWTDGQVAFFFERQGLNQVATAFRDAEIVGKELAQLNYDDLRDLGFAAKEIEQFEAIMSVLQSNV